MRGRRTKTCPPSWTVPFSSYAEVTDFLRGVEIDCILRGRPSDGTVSLGAVARCLHELKRPDLAYRSIHVTGTNGKTTVSRMIGALIRATGLTVGVYTSPHVLNFRERIAINGQPIGEVPDCDSVTGAEHHAASALPCVCRSAMRRSGTLPAFCCTYHTQAWPMAARPE